MIYWNFILFQKIITVEEVWIVFCDSPFKLLNIEFEFWNIKIKFVKKG